MSSTFQTLRSFNTSIKSMHRRQQIGLTFHGELAARLFIAGPGAAHLSSLLCAPWVCMLNVTYVRDGTRTKICLARSSTSTPCTHGRMGGRRGASSAESGLHTYDFSSQETSRENSSTLCGARASRTCSCKRRNETSQLLATGVMRGYAHQETVDMIASYFVLQRIERNGECQASQVH